MRAPRFTWPTRAATVLLVALGGLLALAGPASAHQTSGSGATNFQSTLTSVTPAVPGLSVEVVENGIKLELVNHTGRTVTVLGYSGEPYLRVRADGVDENLRSSATYLNRTTRLGNVTVPPTADNKGVEWKAVSSSPVAVWHDHRIHWMGTTLPPIVQGAKGSLHRIDTWHVPVLVGTQRVVLTGSLDWVPGPSPAKYLLLMLGVFVAVVPLLLLLRSWAAAVALLALTAADATHMVGVAAANARTSIVHALYYYPLNMAVWVIALAAVAMLAMGRRRGWPLALFPAAAMLLVGGVARVGVLSHSAAPFAWPLRYERLLTVGEIAGGLAIIVATIIVLRPWERIPPESSTATPEGTVAGATP